MGEYGCKDYSIYMISKSKFSKRFLLFNNTLMPLNPVKKVYAICGKRVKLKKIDDRKNKIIE
jgi:hypothetical protein